MIKTFLFQPALVAIFFAASIFSTAFAATTDPVGYTNCTVPMAASPTNPSLKLVSAPLYYSPVDSGKISGVGAATVTNSAANWGTLTEPANPHLLLLKSGASIGRNFLITGNTGTQLTLNTDGVDLTAILANNDQYSIIPAPTLGKLFGTSAVPFKTGNSAGLADNVLLWSGTGWDTYFHNGTNWRKGLSNANNEVVYPEEGMFIIRRDTTSDLKLTFIGTVPTVAQKSLLLGPGSTLLANRFPKEITLAQTGIYNLANWQTGNSAGNSDNILLWNGTGWDTYFHNGTSWRKGLANADTVVVPVNAAMFIIRRSSATLQQAVLDQPLPYAL